MALSGLGVRQAILVPSLKDVMVEIPGLPTQFEGYTLLQLTDLHISRLFDACPGRTCRKRWPVRRRTCLSSCGTRHALVRQQWHGTVARICAEVG